MGKVVRALLSHIDNDPLQFLDQLRTIEHLFPEWNGVHHSN